MEMFWACAPSAKDKSASARMMSCIRSSSVLVAADFNAKFAQRLFAALARRPVHFAIEAAALAIHGDDERTETAHAELPQRLGIEVIEIDLLDRLDPRRLERRRAADDGEVGAAKVFECLLRAITQAAFANHQSHAVLLHQRARETLHAIARRGADAN